jgi:hypothetical protein
MNEVAHSYAQDNPLVVVRRQRRGSREILHLPFLGTSGSFRLRTMEKRAPALLEDGKGRS